MSKKGLKENQIFAARDTVEENDKIKAAREAVAADPTNAEKYMALGLAPRGKTSVRAAPAPAPYTSPRSSGQQRRLPALP